MPEQEDNKKPSFTRPSKILQAARHWRRAWDRLPPGKKFNRALIGIVILGLSAAGWLLNRSMWIASAIALGVAGLAMLLLVLRVKPTPPKPGRRRLLIALGVFAISGGILWWWYRNQRQIKISRFHNHLKNSGLPPELYDHQAHLETLTINQSPSTKPALSDLDWLNSDELKNLKLVAPNLTSLNGLAQLTGLRSVDIDLNHVPLESLQVLPSLNGLRTLILRNIGHAKNQLSPGIGQAFPELTTLHLDFNHSYISSFPDLAPCQQLQDVTLNLRSTARLSELPDLSKLPNLQTVALFVDNSHVSSLETLLKKIATVEALILSLDGTQLELLSTLGESAGPEVLDLTLTSPPNSKFPDLSGMGRLNTLILRMPGPRGDDLPDKTPVPDISHLRQLKGLSIFLNGSEVPVLPPVGNLTALLKLSLNLKGSKVQKLPDISRLNNLQRLTLDIGNTGITELPDFAPFSKLVELHLLLENATAIHSLPGIENLAALETLELDICGTKITGLDAIVKLGTLKHLSLILRWEQVHDLPDLALLKSLQSLELHLHGGWTPQELPNFGGLESLEELTLDIKDSHITQLPALSQLPNLRKMTLNLENSGIQDLSTLENVNSLREVVVNLSGTRMQTLPDLKSLSNLQKVAADIRHSEVTLTHTRRLAKLRELTIDHSFLSLEDLPESVRILAIAP